MRPERDDKTVIVKCEECSAEATGFEEMISHIIDFHPIYSPTEAHNFAKVWTECAHERYEEEARDYYEARRNEDSDD